MRTALGYVLFVVCLVVSGITCWRLSTENRSLKLALTEATDGRVRLKHDLGIVTAEATRSRQLLRQQTLTQTTRTPDEQLALFPATFPQGDWTPAESEFEDCWFEAEDGLRLHGWMLRAPQPAATLLVLHGNAGNVTNRAPFALELRRRCGLSVFLLDYRGYGRSEGVPTFPGLLLDARAARRAAADRVGIHERDLLILGESLGGAIAVQLAAKEGARALVLDSTFASLERIASTRVPSLLSRVMIGNKLNSVEMLANYHGPLLQFHGVIDNVVPIEQGRQLFAAANEPKIFVPLSNHNHNDPRPEIYYTALGEFISKLPASSVAK